jgi:hypothetical protein
MNGLFFALWVATFPAVVTGYTETYYGVGGAQFRGFDGAPGFALSNLILDAEVDDERIIGHLALQAGDTPDIYYSAERGGTGWKHLQVAYGGYRLWNLELTAGLFLSPVGPESMRVYDSWNWSRSNLFYALPFYHTGARAAAELGSWTITTAVYNGWNSIVDNNLDKTISGGIAYNGPDIAVSALYMGGVELLNWRHMADLHTTWQVADRLAVIGHLNAGLEDGVSRWMGSAVYARLEILPTLFVAGRGDVLVERSDGEPIFFPAHTVSSGTVTLEFRPINQISGRIEYRQDWASAEMYAGSRTQKTATLGIATRF